MSSDVKAFYGVGKNLEYSLDKVQVIDKNGNIYLPIAVDSFGNNFIVDIIGNTGFFVDHEKNRELKPVAECLYLLFNYVKANQLKKHQKNT